MRSWTWRNPRLAGESNGSRPIVSAGSDAGRSCAQDEQEQADADDRVDLEERLVDPAQVVGPDDPVFVAEQHGDRADAGEEHPPQVRLATVEREEQRRA